MDYEVIIIGGGSAGCVLANRLSADPRRRVLLVEAGPDMVEGHIPEALLDSYPGAAYINPAYTWNALRVTTDPWSDNDPASARRKMYEQARVMGGGSSINGQAANRGAPDDYDEWVRRGAEGWGWDDVLPYFKRLERDLDFDGALHGREGPIAIRRVPTELWPGHAMAVAAALKAEDVPWLPDQNGPFASGAFPLAISNAGERRVSTATGYLDPAIRRRANLHISPDTVLTELLFDGTRCTGVALSSGDETRTCSAHEVIVSAGAINSPAILLRAGIGPAHEIKERGGTVRAHRIGVGRGLMDHPIVALASFIKPEARVDGRTRRHMLLGWRYTSGIGDAENDMCAITASRTAWHAVGRQIGTTLLMVYKTFSETGAVRLASADWREPPEVRFNLLSDERDLERLERGFHDLARLNARPELASVTSDPFPAVWGDKVRQAGVVTRRNRLKTDLAARLLDGPDWLRRRLLHRFVSGGYTLADVLRDRDVLRSFIREGVVGAWHASCSCRMGQADDPAAVTDSQGRVHGVQNLRVVDASIFPAIPRANTNIPAIMVAEKIAAGMVRAASIDA